MALDRILSSTEISASGLAAERLRMETVANNIANAHSTRSPDGGQYRRRQVVFAAAMQDAAGASTNSAANLRGVEVVGIQPSTGELPRVYNPSHPDADPEGFVLMPNISVPEEMVDLITASRAYDANLKALRTFKQMVEQSLSLLRGTQS
jgi:flagellar basal-body rod protein FlgC